MKILYDHQIFSIQKYGGISRYFSELITNIVGTKVYHTTLFTNNQYLDSHKSQRYSSFFLRYNFRGKTRLLNLINKTYTKNQIRNGNFDIFHPTYYDPYFLKYLNGKPFVLTIPDMIHEKFAEMFNKKDKTSEYKKHLAFKAAKIIVVSDSAKKDLMEIFGINESKIEVIYLANSLTPGKAVSTKINLPSKYILFIGSRGGYKNFNRFIESISKLLHEIEGLSVLCIGGQKFNKGEQELFKKLNILNKVNQYNVEDDLMAQIYSRSLVFVFPSLYEGFGIPILESFACKCPLVCSNTSSLPEIAGDAAEYFDPYSKDAIYSSVKKVILNEDIRSRLIVSGTVRLKDFSWTKTANKTLGIYEEILKSN